MGKQQLLTIFAAPTMSILGWLLSRRRSYPIGFAQAGQLSR
jgi:hypothetical protein